MTVNKINLNSDIAEHDFQFYQAVDKPLIASISSANLSCLFHGGQREVVENAVIECIKHNVSIGAHISFLDKENFGRSKREWDQKSINSLLQEQMNFLSNVCKTHNEHLTHLKLHGALSNMASKDTNLAKIIVSFLKANHPDLIVLAPALSELAKVSQEEGLQTALEVFADRTYEDNGMLTPRSINGSLITSPIIAVNHVKAMLEKKAIISRTGIKISTKFDSICVHSDTPNSVKICNEICILLNSMSIEQKKLNEFFD
tara:strand:- start:1666 stop:2442 length:777 start_codon:yes stop_codon:yes gene_type:complete